MKKINYLLLFLVISIISCQTGRVKDENAGNKNQKSAPVLVNENIRTRIDSALKSMVQSGKIAGVSALIYEKDKEVYYKAFGFADREAKTEMDRNTAVRIYSMTKPITGTALMQLFEKGAFELDDPLSKYAPEFADMKVFAGVDDAGNIKTEPVHRPITIRDLTRHTAGFAGEEHPVLGELVKKADALNKTNTLSEMAKKLSSLPLAFQPGEEWGYGVSVDVQAYLVELLSGKAFDEYIKENILDPLGMENTAYVPIDFKKLAAVYQMGDDRQLKRIPDEQANVFNRQSWPLKPGGWGLTSTLDDYMNFARMLLNDGRFNNTEILKEETVKLMSTNQLAESVTERMWLPTKGQVGFGIDFAVRIDPPMTAEENNGAVGEFFWDGAASTLFWVDPKNEITAVFFVQKLPFDGELHKIFRDAVYGKFDDLK